MDGGGAGRVPRVRGAATRRRSRRARGLATGIAAAVVAGALAQSAPAMTLLCQMKPTDGTKVFDGPIVVRDEGEGRVAVADAYLAENGGPVAASRNVVGRRVTYRYMVPVRFSGGTTSEMEVLLRVRTDTGQAQATGRFRDFTNRYLGAGKCHSEQD